MNRKIILHDLEKEAEEMIIAKISEKTTVFAAKPKVHHCVGCFNCWVKTPGKCAIADRCQKMPKMLAHSDEMIIISRMLYGGYSPEIKAVLDRSIGYIMPYFRIVKGEMHHAMRYNNPFKLSSYFYGNIEDETECLLAEQLVAANAVNLGAGSCQVRFCKSAEVIEEVMR